MKQRLMAEPRHCAQCGVVLSVYSLEGVCGNCLLKPGLEPMPEALDEPADESHLPALRAQTNPSANTEAVGRFGDYELLEEIARGGMGIVYRARQVSLDRIVAVKMLLAGPLAGKDFVQRFRTEAAAAASLHHPNIVAIHEVGFAQGQHFFAMDFVEGLTLAQLVAKGPLPPRQAATYLKTVAEAIHFAHERNVLHRDLKPSNVLVDSATDQPRVTDFGLAKRLEAETDLTLSGQLLGSPNYMSPEQSKAKRGTVGKRSDVYSLGAILYHLLTGRPPFQGETLTEVLRQLADTDPLAPHLLIPRVPPDLETICVKCLEKEPAKRYQSAQELADELGRFLRHEPIHARPITRAERAWRWCRRKPALAGLILALHLVLALGLTGVIWQWRRATASETMIRRNLYTADMNLAHQAWNEGSLQRAQKLLRAHLPQAGKEDLRGFEWRYLWRLCQDESRVTFTNVHFAGNSHGLALAADGQTLIAASGDSLKWLDRQKHREVQIVTVATNAIGGLSMSGDQPGLVAYHTDRIKALSPAGEELLGGGLAPGLGGGASVGSYGAFALSWDGSMLAASGSNTALSTVRIFALKTGKPVGPAFSLGEKENIVSLAFSPDSRYLACGTFGTKIHILEAPSLKPGIVLTGHTASVSFLAFDRAGAKLVSRGGDGHIRVWSFPDGRLLAELPDQGGGLGDLAFSPDGLRLASGQTDTVRLWNLARLEIPPTFLHGHIGTVRSLLFSRDGNELYTGSVDGTVKVWDVSAKGSTNILHHPDWTDEVSFSPDGKLLAVADFNDRTAGLWDVTSQRRVGKVGEHTNACRGAKFSPDGKLVATVGDYDDVQIWSISPIKRIWNFPKVDYSGSIAFHPSKPLLAVGCGDLRFWDLQTGTRINLLPAAPTNDLRSVCFSPDGNRLALGMENGEVSIWDFVTGRRLRWFQEHTNQINALCFSHHGTWLASGGKDNRVALYEVRKGVFTRQLQGHTDWVFGLAFAPDDKTLVSTSWDGTIRFWSLANYQVALMLAPGGEGVNSVAFSPDKNLMATCGSDGTVRLWPAAKFSEITASEKDKRKKP
jgi:WD40 repeat protein/serine/threonine protein kinase